MADNQVPRASFLIRIWRERGQLTWRVWVQHIQSGESAYLRCFDELWAFFERWIGDVRDTPHKGLR